MSRWQTMVIAWVGIGVFGACATRAPELRKSDAVAQSSKRRVKVRRAPAKPVQRAQRTPLPSKDAIGVSQSASTPTPRKVPQLNKLEIPRSIAEETATENEAEGLPELESERIPRAMNAMVEKWIHYFTVRDRERFARFLARGSVYRDVVANTLQENELPPELYYLAMIESGYHTAATSHASAVGVWQFIEGTGKRYGLQINRYIDERRDPIRATEAAAKYLKDLYNVFGSWHLAMAAYNAGEYRIVQAVLRGKSRDFWDLVEKKVLPDETANYVPKFLAAVEIGHNLEKYGFKVNTSVKYPELELVELPSPVRLSTVASSLGLPVETLQQVNPHLLNGYTSPTSQKDGIWVPASYAKRAKILGPRLAEFRVSGIKPTREVAAQKLARQVVVRRGDTLSSIARGNQVSVSYLKRVNELKSDQLRVGQKLSLVAQSYHQKASAKSKTATYRVKRGDNLTQIARRFNVSVQELKRINSLKRNQVNAGEVLVVSR